MGLVGEMFIRIEVSSFRKVLPSVDNSILPVCFLEERSCTISSCSACSGDNVACFNCSFKKNFIKV